MKIPLKVYPFAGGLRIMANFLLRVEEFSRSIPIQAIVDTGSPLTLIGPIDSKRMRISKIQLDKIIGKKKPVNIGGGKIITKIIENSKLRFGENLEFQMPVEFPVEGNDNSQQPSLLGVDFMLKTGAKLIFDPSNKIAYFEIDD
jgi:hypothetical protein